MERRRNMKILLDPFIAWQTAAPQRHVDIDIKTGYDGSQEVSIWVYDYSIMQGQHVTCVEEIDLPGEVEKTERKKLAELTAKYTNAISGGVA
jgi:hypothetical protein